MFLRPNTGGKIDIVRTAMMKRINAGQALQRVRANEIFPEMRFSFNTKLLWKSSTPSWYGHEFLMLKTFSKELLSLIMLLFSLLFLSAVKICQALESSTQLVSNPKVDVTITVYHQFFISIKAWSTALNRQENEIERKC